MKKTFQDVLRDIQENLIGKTLHGISGAASSFIVTKVDYQNDYIVLDVQGKRKTWSFERMNRVWNEMYYRPAANVEVVFGGSGSSRNQVETIYASLAYVEWLYIKGKKCVAYVGADCHPYGELRHMDREKEEQYSALMATTNPRNPLLDPDENPDGLKDTGKKISTHTGYKSNFERNRILFGAPGTGKSFTLNRDLVELLGANNEDDYERVTFHPDYSYANFVGTYKPVMMDDSTEIISLATEKEVLVVLTDDSMSAQEKYDLLYDKFKGDGLTRLPLLLGLYTDENFKTRKVDGSDAAGDNSVERNHGRAIRPYVNLSKPSVGKKDISYEYVPGPFMRIYVKALKNSRTDNIKPFLLIIEEINRANVAAVFGDIFQLLDRGDDFVSEYPIQATEDIKKYLAKEIGGNPDDYKKIRIPDNMFIWATMNSADQGVFPMDTAFKRRWDFTYLGIDDNDKELQGKYVYLTDDKSQKVEWNKLRKAINNFLAKEKINEDKHLGPYFISRSIIVPEKGDEIDRDKFIRTFKSKVIMYLFEDAAKQKRSRLFEGCSQNNNRYSEICKEFEAKGVGIFNHDIQLECEIEVVKLNDELQE